MFHSLAKHELGIYPFDDPILDRELESYAISLTKGKPDYPRLKRIHRRIAAQEPLTILMHHKACLQGHSQRVENTRSRDWFKDLIL